MNLPRLLLVTGVVPGRGSGAREYLRSACRLLPRDRVFCFSFEAPTAERLDPGLEGLEIEHAPAPPERGVGWPGEGRFGVVRHLAELRLERTHIPALIERIVRYGQVRKVDRLWVPLHSPTTVRVAWEVAGRLGVPLQTTVWDPPDAKLRQFGLGRRMRRRLQHLFDAAVRGSETCGVASDPMRDLFHRLYGTHCLTMILGAQRSSSVTSPNGSEDGPLRVGFAGSLYARREFDALVQALSSRGWRLGGREVELALFGEHDDGIGGSNGHVRIHGWKDSRTLVECLSACNAAYLPYWFDRGQRQTVELAFPGKLAAYAAARTPVLYHGPSYASPVRFLERYPMGRVCASLDPNEVARMLEQVMTDAGWRARAQRACDAAYEEQLCHAVFRGRFAELLEVDVDALQSGNNGG